MSIIYRWAYPKVFEFRRLIFIVSTSDEDCKSVLSTRQASRKLA